MLFNQKSSDVNLFQLTRFILADKNLTFHPTSSISPISPILIQDLSIFSTMLHLPASSLGSLNTKTLLSASIQAIPASETPVLLAAPDQNQVSDTFEDSESDLSDALSSDKEQQNALRQSVYTKANHVNQKKSFQKSKAAIAKTNLSVPIGSPPFKASHILFDYTLNQPKK